MNNNRWPTNFSGNFVAGANDHASYMIDGQLLGGLGACNAGGASPAITIEATPIPQWVWLVAGGVALLMLLKKKGR